MQCTNRKEIIISFQYHIIIGIVYCINEISRNKCGRFRRIFLIAKQNYEEIRVSESVVRNEFRRCSLLACLHLFSFGSSKDVSSCSFRHTPAATYVRARAGVHKCSGMLVQDIADNAFEAYTNPHV